MSRPEQLFPLFAELETLAGLGPKTVKNFAALGITLPRDLLFLLPHSGIDRSRKSSLRDVTFPATVTVEVEVGSHFPPPSRGRPYRLQRLSREDVWAADELLLTSATKEVLAITLLDGKPVGNAAHRGRPGPVCQELHAAYQAAKLTDRQ